LDLDVYRYLSKANAGTKRPSGYMNMVRRTVTCPKLPKSCYTTTKKLRVPILQQEYAKQAHLCVAENKDHIQ